MLRRLRPDPPSPPPDPVRVAATSAVPPVTDGPASWKQVKTRLLDSLQAAEHATRGGGAGRRAPNPGSAPLLQLGPTPSAATPKD